MRGNKIRNGKIAKLPAHIREELNSRIQNGETGTHLVDWLNGLPEVQAVLAEHFEGKKIIPQNMYEWRIGGYAEWLLRKKLSTKVPEETEDENLRALRAACQRVVVTMMVEWMDWHKLANEANAATKLN